ncbi:MAG TPA: HD domain-containing protein [Candidatus Nanopelagicales bacterium]|nr:HD domain-containing protein [Candidatus Nanopelagicales bacterium]
MQRPYIFRDPVHGDIGFARDGLHELIRKVVDEELFQRLRGIKQNGVLNLVFHGAEHSRFTHSLGAAHVAGLMYDAACRNSGLTVDKEQRKHTVLAALLHDAGHGPFSHLLEEILGKKRFHHETLTARILIEPGSPIGAHLRAHDRDLPEKLLPFVDDKKWKPRRWYHSIVSSQLDADRLDYTARDAMMAGVVSHRFDRDRLIGSLYVWREPQGPGDPADRAPREHLAVDDRAHDVVENYLLALYHLYRSIYLHHTVRAASWLLNAALRRARQLCKTDSGLLAQIFPELGGRRDPLWALMEEGHEVSLEEYARLDEAHVWGLVQRWRSAEDATLRDLCDRLKQRRFLKAIDIAATATIGEALEMKQKATERFQRERPEFDAASYVHIDEISRENYKPYRWGKRRGDDSGADPIWLVSKNGVGRPLEDEAKTMIELLDTRFAIRRLIVPDEIRTALTRDASDA